MVSSVAVGDERCWKDPVAYYKSVAEDRSLKHDEREAASLFTAASLYCTAAAAGGGREATDEAVTLAERALSLFQDLGLVDAEKDTSRLLACAETGKVDPRAAMRMANEDRRRFCERIQDRKNVVTRARIRALDNQLAETMAEEASAVAKANHFRKARTNLEEAKACALADCDRKEQLRLDVKKPAFEFRGSLVYKGEQEKTGAMAENLQVEQHQLETEKNNAVAKAQELAEERRRWEELQVEADRAFSQIGQLRTQMDAPIAPHNGNCVSSGVMLLHPSPVLLSVCGPQLMLI